MHFAGRQLAWASPAVFTVGTYLGFYGIGLLIGRPSPRFQVFTLAVVLGLAGLLAGIGFAFGRAVARPGCGNCHLSTDGS